MRVLHLNNGGKGMMAVTACGRNIMNTPMSVNWSEYKVSEAKGWKLCARCEASSLKAFYVKQDAKAAAQQSDDWEPVADEVWQAQDKAAIAAARQKRRGVSFVTKSVN